MSIIESILVIICVSLIFLLFVFRNKFKLKLQKIELENINKHQELTLQNESLVKELDSKTKELEKLESKLLENTQNHKSEILEIQTNYDKKITQIIESKDTQITQILNEKEKTIADITQSKDEKIESILKENEIKIKNALQEQEAKLDSINKEKQSELRELLNTERERQIALLQQNFNDISSKIFDEKTKQFSEKQDISLKPLLSQIELFKKEIEKNTKDSAEKHIRLEEHIKKLLSESDKVAKEANNLTNALKGDNKMQGGWGEILLERLLELSGLKKGIEYETQVSIKNENANLRPDVIIALPGARKIVVDSKVSLSAYERYINGGDKLDLSAHLESVKSHIKSLQSKEYQKLVGSGEKLNFVIMFMPIEGAFSAIVGDGLFEEGFRRGVIMATPSTLLVILRLIESIWSNEAKDKNMLKILEECEKLIKKYDGFKGNMDKIETSLSRARESFEDAKKQLISGRGSFGNILGNINDYMKNVPALQDSKDIEADAKLA